MDHQRSRGTELRGDLELVAPATVVGHGSPTEDVLAGRIIDQDEQDLAAHVQSFEVVPFVFRSDGAVAHENELAFHFHRFNATSSYGHVCLLMKLGRDVSLFYPNRIRFGRSQGDQRDLLDKGAVRVAGDQTE